MIGAMTRHKIQVLREAGHSQRETAELAGVSERSVRRVEGELAVEEFGQEADQALRQQARIGRPSKVESFRNAHRARPGHCRARVGRVADTPRSTGGERLCCSDKAEATEEVRYE